MNEVIIIPTRWQSSRFPGKPLANILGKSLIQRVWIKCAIAVDPKKVYIATDDERIRQHCVDNNMQYIMTHACATGTDRVSQAYKKLGEKYDTIINVQGDEPLIDPEDILKLIEASSGVNSTTICCGVCKIRSEKEFKNPNIIKIITDSENYLMYASRAGIPTNKKLGFEWAYKQVCIYAFSPTALSVFDSSDNRTSLELIEDIEFLRFLEWGYRIKMIKVSESSVAVDVPEDVEKVENVLKRRNEY